MPKKEGAAGEGGDKKEEGAGAGEKGDGGGQSGGKSGAGGASGGAASSGSSNPSPQSGSKSPQGGGSAGGSSGAGSLGEGSDGTTSGVGDVSPSGTAIPLPPGEKANLEYSKKATDLVLKYLDDEERRKDPELLRELGWSAEDMDKFHARWKAMKDAAESLPEGEGEVPADELDDAIRSLGLSPKVSSKREANVRDDGATGDRVDGAVNQPPIDYLEQFRAFQRSRNR